MMFQIKHNSLSFDNASTLIMASFWMILKAYLFNNEKFIYISLFQITKSTVICIESYLFLFAIFNVQLQIPSRIGINQGKYIQKLSYHLQPIYHNLVNIQILQFHVMINDWKGLFCIKQSLLQSEFSYINNIRIFSVSFNEKGDKLIITNYSNSIVKLIKRGTYWMKQKILIQINQDNEQALLEMIHFQSNKHSKHRICTNLRIKAINQLN
ncbi:unnamed protein product [Paramecium pentaurelia]|uniref:Transmembrane protein n=1 Tax=Paramecium pentaurelia TaxID=43138 RepID=A0A8S1WF93_9CILI|nr:unnamed protein product [Paramecium pentaurelia]